MKKTLIWCVAVLGLAGFAACGGDKKDKDENEPTELTDAGTGDAGPQSGGDAGTADAGTDAGTDAGDEDDAGGPQLPPETFVSCSSGDYAAESFGDLSVYDGKRFTTRTGTYYDWGEGLWEVEWYSNEVGGVWVDVNNGDNAKTSIGVGSVGVGGKYMLGRVEYDDDDGVLYCLDPAYYNYESEKQLPAACVLATIAGSEDTVDAFEMFGGLLTLTKLSPTALAGSVTDGYFVPWASMEYDDEFNEIGCYLPPISFSFDVPVEESQD